MLKGFKGQERVILMPPRKNKWRRLTKMKTVFNNVTSFAYEYNSIRQIPEQEISDPTKSVLSLACLKEFRKEVIWHIFSHVW